MTDRFDHIVRKALASHLGKTIDYVRPSHRLREDYGILPLDMVLIALWLEDVAYVRVPSEQLEGAHTVSDLIHMVRAWARESGARALEPSTSVEGTDGEEVTPTRRSSRECA